MQSKDLVRPADAAVARLSYPLCWRVWIGAAMVGWAGLALLVIVF